MKIALLDQKVDHDLDSENSDEEMLEQKEIDEKVDGLLQFTWNLPFAFTKISQFYEAMHKITSVESKQVLKEFKDYFENELVWQTNENLEIDIEKFFSSCIFKA